MTTTHTSPGSGTERIKLFDHYPPLDDIDAISEWHAQRLILLMQYTNESRKLLERYQGTADHMMMMINETDRNLNKKAWKRKKPCSHDKSRSSSSSSSRSGSRSRSRSRSKKRRSHSRSPRSHTRTHSDTHTRRTREIRNGVDTTSNALSSEVVAKRVPGHYIYHTQHLNMNRNMNDMNGMNYFHQHHQQHPYQDEYHAYKYKHDHENEDETRDHEEIGGGISEDAAAGADAGACADTVTDTGTGTGTGTGAVIQFEFPTNHDHDLFLMRELKGTSLSSLRNCDRPTCTFTRTRGISESYTSTSSTSSALISPSIKSKPIFVPKATTDRNMNKSPHIYNSSDAPALYGQSFSLDSYDGTTNANTNANTNTYFEESRMHKVASSPGSSRSRPGSAFTSTGNGAGAGAGTTLDTNSDSFSNKYGLQHHLPYHQSSSYMNMKMNI